MAHKITLSFSFEGFNHVKSRRKKAIKYLIIFNYFLVSLISIESNFYIIEKLV